MSFFGNGNQKEVVFCIEKLLLEITDLGESDVNINA